MDVKTYCTKKLVKATLQNVKTKTPSRRLSIPDLGHTYYIREIRDDGVVVFKPHRFEENGIERTDALLEDAIGVKNGE